MASRTFEWVEFFHLQFLRHLSARLSGRPYAVKGGVCLRFFHRSVRLSQDLDIDLTPQISLSTLQKAVDTILESRPLASSLASQGLSKPEWTKPKQTETTQRWKIGLRAGLATPIPTKIEFNRRKEEVPYTSGVPDAELLSAYKTFPFAAQYYDAVRMTQQKIEALGSAGRFAVRDLFDLHHLFKTLRVNPQEGTQGIDPNTMEDAIKKTERFTARDFREQVWPFLTPDFMALYDPPQAFENIKAEVLNLLRGGRP